MSKTTAKTFLSLIGSSLAASEAPSGAQRTVRGTMQTRLARLTRPIVPAGASLGVLPSSNMVSAPGKEMISPIAAAVPTAL